MFARFSGFKASIFLDKQRPIIVGLFQVRFIATRALTNDLDRFRPSLNLFQFRVEIRIVIGVNSFQS